MFRSHPPTRDLHSIVVLGGEDPELAAWARRLCGDDDRVKIVREAPQWTDAAAWVLVSDARNLMVVLGRDGERLLVGRLARLRDLSTVRHAALVAVRHSPALEREAAQAGMSYLPMDTLPKSSITEAIATLGREIEEPLAV